MGQVFSKRDWDSCVYKRSKSDKCTISPALFLCIPLLPDVVMFVCRRCVGRVDIEMGGKAGIWVGSVSQGKSCSEI